MFATLSIDRWNIYEAPLLGLLPFSNGNERFPIRCQNISSVFLKDNTVLTDNDETFLTTALLALVFKGRVQFANPPHLSTLGYLERQFRI